MHFVSYCLRMLEISWLGFARGGARRRLQISAQGSDFGSKARFPIRWFIVAAGAITDIDYSAAQSVRDLLEDLRRCLRSSGQNRTNSVPLRLAKCPSLDPASAEI